jgi:hypothetical protein
MAMRFFCDAMLGGLARWLRAAGYDSAFELGIDDGVLVRRARESGRVLLSSDGGVFKRAVVRDGIVRSLYVPRELDKMAQLGFVLRRFELPLRDSRCMNCGGELVAIDKALVAGKAPPRAYACCDRFYRCASCDKLLWEGTHWRSITERLAEAYDSAADVTRGPDPSDATPPSPSSDPPRAR